MGKDGKYLFYAKGQRGRGDVREGGREEGHDICPLQCIPVFL